MELDPKTSELRSYVKVEVAFLGFPSLKVLMVSVDVKANSPYGLCGRKATLN